MFGFLGVGCARSIFVVFENYIYCLFHYSIEKHQSFKFGAVRPLLTYETKLTMIPGGPKNVLLFDCSFKQDAFC